MPMDHESEKSAWFPCYDQPLPHDSEATPRRVRHRKLLWRLTTVVLAASIYSWALPGQHAGLSLLEASRPSINTFDWYAVRGQW